jgi:hypothetical protein
MKIRTNISKPILLGLEMQVLDNIGASDNKKENHLAGSLYDLIGKAGRFSTKPCRTNGIKVRLSVIMVKLTLDINEQNSSFYHPLG